MPDSYIDILQPAAGTNYIANPSFELDTNGWTNIFPVGSDFLFSTDISSNLQYVGAYSLRMRTTSAFSDGTFGVSYKTPNMPTSAVPYTMFVSAYVNFAARLIVQNETGSTVLAAGSTTIPLGSMWFQVKLTYNESGGTARIIRIDTPSGISSQFPLYIDAVQYEIASGTTTYIDGDQDDCNWLGAPHNSPSARLPRTTSGGIWRNLTTDLNAQLLEVPGFGMPPVTPVLQKYALLSGGYYQRTQPNVRPLTIAASVIGTSLAGMYALRNNLIARIIPDQADPMQPITIRYTGQGGRAMIRAVYDGGMEISNRSGFTEAIGVKFQAPDPFWYAENDQGTTLQTGLDTTFIGLVGQTNNAWATINYPGTQYGWFDSALGTNNTIYLVGTTGTTSGSQTHSIYPYSPTLSSLYTNDTGWGSQIVPGVNLITNITADSANNLYVTGFQQNVGSPQNLVLRVYKVSGSATTQIGTLPNASAQGWVIHSIVASQSGSIYIGGTFGSFNGAGTIKNLGVYDGTNWYGFASYPNNRITAMRTSGDTLYMAGSFTATSVGGVSLLRVAQYSETTRTFSQIGAGLNNTAQDIEVAPDGRIYAIGTFTASGSQAIAGSVAVFSGNTWLALGTGLALNTAGTTAAIKARANGDILFYGLATGTATPGIVRWNGYAYTTIDAWINATITNVVEVETDIFATTTARTGATGTLTDPTPVTVNNTGSASASPIFRFTSTANAVVTQITNYTTNQAIYLNLPIGVGDIVTVDTRQGRVSINSVRFGNRIAYLLPGSQFASFDLLPGNNVISAFAYNLSGGVVTGGGQSSVVTCAVYWRRKHWSADAT